MKNIIDFYECGINATPANTMGMGNPCAPTDTTVGSEPLIPNCKKGKCKKEKAKKSEKIEEASILGDIEDTIQVGDDVVEFAQWLIDSADEGFKLAGTDKFKSEGLLPKLATCISTPSRGVFVIDTFKLFDAGCGMLCDRVHLTENSLKKLPKGLKTIKIYNYKYGDYQMSCYTHDVSKIGIEIYADEGRSYGNLHAIFWSKLKDKNVKLGKITCSNFKVGTYASKIESIMLAKDSTMIEVDLSDNDNLTDVYGRFDHAMSVKFPRQLVARQLASAGIIPHGCELKIYG